MRCAGIFRLTAGSACGKTFVQGNTVFSPDILVCQKEQCSFVQSAPIVIVMLRNQIGSFRVSESPNPGSSDLRMTGLCTCNIVQQRGGVKQIAVQEDSL